MTGKPDQPRIIGADAAGIATAAALLRAGRLVAVPTETVYGLAARADSPDAVAAIYQAKGRPDFNPLIVHVPSLAAAEALGEFGDQARRMARRWWPGPLTMVVPLKVEAGIAPAVSAGLATVALRCPAHPVMRAVLLASSLPLAAPSANRSGALSPTRPGHVAASLGGQVDLVLDGGACPSGIESTIVALLPGQAWRILRPGPISAAQLAQLAGSEPAAPTTSQIEAPGQLARHYAPGKPVRMRALSAEADEFLIGFGAVAGHLSLSPAGDPLEAARHLYEALHQAAAAPQPRIAVAPIPNEGLGAAINDRLQRAAA